jgi:hypothetical protein
VHTIYRKDLKYKEKYNVVQLFCVKHPERERKNMNWSEIAAEDEQPLDMVDLASAGTKPLGEAQTHATVS